MAFRRRPWRSQPRHSAHSQRVTLGSHPALCCMSPWLICFLSAAPCAIAYGDAVGLIFTGETSGFRRMCCHVCFFKGHVTKLRQDELNYWEGGQEAIFLMYRGRDWTSTSFWNEDYTNYRLWYSVSQSVFSKANVMLLVRSHINQLLWSHANGHCHTHAFDW